MTFELQLKRGEKKKKKTPVCGEEGLDAPPPRGQHLPEDYPPPLPPDHQR